MPYYPNISRQKIISGEKFKLIFDWEINCSQQIQSFSTNFHWNQIPFFLKWMNSHNKRTLRKLFWLIMLFLRIKKTLFSRVINLNLVSSFASFVYGESSAPLFDSPCNWISRHCRYNIRGRSPATITRFIHWPMLIAACCGLIIEYGTRPRAFLSPIPAEYLPNYPFYRPKSI